MAAFRRALSHRPKRRAAHNSGFSSHLCAHTAQGKFSHPASNGAFQRHEGDKKECWEEKETNIELLQRVFKFFFYFFKQDMFIKRTLVSSLKDIWLNHAREIDKALLPSICSGQIKCFLADFYRLLGSILREKRWQFIVWNRSTKHTGLRSEANSRVGRLQLGLCGVWWLQLSIKSTYDNWGWC